MVKLKKECRRFFILNDALFLVSLILLLMTIPSYIVFKYIMWYGISYKLVFISFMMGTTVIIFCIFLTGITREGRKALIKGLDLTIYKEDKTVKFKLSEDLYHGGNYSLNNQKIHISRNSLNDIFTGHLFVKIQTDSTGDLLVPKFLINSEKDIEEIMVINKI